MAKSNVKLKTIGEDMEKKLLHQDLLTERDSDEDGGAKTRFTLDSDFSYSSEEENAHHMADPEDINKGKEDWSQVLTKVRDKNNTGVKGVRADYEEAKAITKRRQETKRLRDMENFKRSAYGAKMKEGETSVSYSATMDASKLKKYDADDEDNDDGEDSSDEDAEFLEYYRQQRMQEMSGYSHLPQHGRVVYVEKFSFLDEVDGADPRTYVVTHIFEEYIEACKKMNLVLDQFAAKHQHVKVLKLGATEASQTLSHRSLPAFLVYRAGEMVSDSSLGVDGNMFGNVNFGLHEVEVFLTSKYGIPLSGVDVTEKERAALNHATQQAELIATGDAGWQGSFKPSVGTVNLLQSRVKGLTLQADDDDDDW